jgi:hypothetical protein
VQGGPVHQGADRQVGQQQAVGLPDHLAPLQQEGTRDGFEPVALGPHGGDLAGSVLVKGDKETVAQLRVDDEFVRITARAQLVHSNVGAGVAPTSPALACGRSCSSETERRLDQLRPVVLRRGDQRPDRTDLQLLISARLQAG